ncbi:MAG: hypothetical protein R2793_08355 [Flavobacteriaceae bacterium]
MKKLIFIIVISVLFIGCNDGDVIVTSFDFENATLQVCGSDNSYLFFKINTAKTESISLLVANTSDDFATNETLSVPLDGSSNVVNYRIYNGEVTASYFCNEVPPTSPTVTSEYLGSAGTAQFTIDPNYDDNDGITAENEFNGDSDGDGLLDYYDFDDDGDNVPTLLELDTENADGDNNPLTNPKDTDGDGIPDYLDEDDDGDGVLTRDEDLNGDLDPTNDISDTNVGPNFLNASILESFTVDAYREHSFEFSSDVDISINNLVLVNGNEQITYENIDFGVIQSLVSGVITIIPNF